jgi:hypothetical protein
MDSARAQEVEGLMSIRRTRMQTLVLVLAYLGVAHFLVGLLLTLRVMFASGSTGIYFRFLLPYLAIIAIFAGSAVLGHVRRFRWSGLLLVLGIVASVGACVYDFQNHRYQATGSGIGPQYFIWWWYYEPFWHGYKPGNV